MGIDCIDPADFARLLLQFACIHCALHSEMSIILPWIGTAPIRLAGIGFQHCCAALRWPLLRPDEPFYHSFASGATADCASLTSTANWLPSESAHQVRRSLLPEW